MFTLAARALTPRHLAQSLVVSTAAVEACIGAAALVAVAVAVAQIFAPWLATITAESLLQVVAVEVLTTAATFQVAPEETQPHLTFRPEAIRL